MDKSERLIDLGLIVLLISINFICFGRTLFGYFLADDYVHIAYLSHVFHGHPQLLLQNFYTNWMQTEGTQFYRPLISLTLAWDYLLFGANAFGYHLSNTLFQVGSAIFLFLAVRRLINGYSRRQATLAAFFTAALFSAHPLHPEVVSWVIGRVDSVCALFYLLSIWLFLKADQDNCRWAQLASLAAFVLSLLSKEMAISLPPTITFYCLLSAFSLPSSTAKKIDLKTVLKEFVRQTIAAFKKTGIFWLVLIVYLLGRALALGTISGGYSGSVGEGLNASLYHRLFSDGSLARVLFPFDIDSFSTSLYRNLRWLYVISTISIVVRLLLSRQASGISRYVLFALGWFVLCMAPTYQVWGLTEHLQGSRFIYLGTAPLCLLLSLALLPLSTSNLDIGINKYVNLRSFRLLGCALLSLFVAVFILICLRNNATWAKAGREVRALRQAIESQCRILSPEKSLVVLNLPQRMGGAHELYNAAMLSVLLQEPLTKGNLANRVITFEPMTYGDSELLNMSRLRRLISKADSYLFVFWDRANNKLVPLDLLPRKASLSFAFFDQNKAPIGIEYSNWKGDNYLVSPVCDMPTSAIDYIDLTVSVAPASSATGSPASNNISPQQFLYLSWSTAKEPIFAPERRLALPLIDDGQAHSYRFYVGEHKTWLMAENVNQLRVDIPFDTGKVVFYGEKCSGGEKLIPYLFADRILMHENVDGVTYMNGDRADFIYDVSQIDGAKSVLVEVSKPNSWFEHYSGDLRDTIASTHSLKTYKLDRLKGDFVIEGSLFPYAAYYEVRIAALAADGKVIGTFSDPINLQIDAGQIDKSRAKTGATK